jgi:uncharacterized cupredoxin-like copper-binding protein
MRKTLALVGAGLLVLAGCGSDDSGGGAGESATVREYRVTVDPAEASAGKVNFNVHNEGKITHEFVIFKTDLAPDELPLNKDGDAVDEEGAGVTHVDEIEDIETGTTRKLSVELGAGKYVLICNLPTHYKLGMHTAFEVK